MNTKCEACDACNLEKNNVQPIGNTRAPLTIFMDKPDSRGEKLLFWLLDKCSLFKEDVCIDYVIRCGGKEVANRLSKKVARTQAITKCCSEHPRPSLAHARSIVAMGRWAMETLTDVKEPKTVVGIKDTASGVWCLYSAAYYTMSPGDCVSAWRVVYKAAEEAGLKPEYKHTAMFDFKLK